MQAKANLFNSSTVSRWAPAPILNTALVNWPLIVGYNLRSDPPMMSLKYVGFSCVTSNVTDYGSLPVYLTKPTAWLVILL